MEWVAAEKRSGMGMAQQKTSEQPALFATNSGQRLRTAGVMEGAISQFRAAITSSPGYAAAHFQLGLALRQQGKSEEAQEEFQKAVRLDPSLPPPASHKN